MRVQVNLFSETMKEFLKFKGTSFLQIYEFYSHFYDLVNVEKGREIEKPTWNFEIRSLASMCFWIAV